MDETLPPPKPPGRGGIAALLWAIRLLALVAAGVSAYLLFISLAEGRTPPGCGPMSDCEKVLDSRWSTWFGIPVSGLAAGAYAVILAASFVAQRGGTPGAKRAGWLVLLAASLASAGAAGWFVWVQLAAVRRTCPYCMAVHACGVLIGFLATVSLVMVARNRSKHRAPAPLGVWRPAVAGGLALVGVVTLAGGQWFWEPPAPPPRIYRAQIGRQLLELNQSELPLVGWAKAPKSVIVINDYTCHHCRDMHALLDAAHKRYGEQFSVTVVTVPLAAKCNPMVQHQVPVHRNSCDLASLALAVWRAKPEAYERMDKFLYAWPAGPGGSLGMAPVEPDAARKFAVELVGEAALDRAMKDPWIAKRIGDNIDIYKRTGGGPYPKLVFPDKAINLDVNDDALVYRTLQKELGL